jgi:hypothetical protein
MQLKHFSSLLVLPGSEQKEKQAVEIMKNEIAKVVWCNDEALGDEGIKVLWNLAIRTIFERNNPIPIT